MFRTTISESLRTGRAWLERLLDPPARARDGGAVGRVRELVLTFAREHRQLMDSGLALAVLVLGVVNGLGATHGRGRDILFTCLLAVPIAGRRRVPITVFAILCGAAFAQWLTFRPCPADIALFIGLYSVAVGRPLRAAIAATLIVETGALMAALRWTPGHWFETFALLSGAIVAAAVLGVHMRERRSYVEGLLERAERLEFERDQHARLAASAERARIAREMHDVIAHSLAVMISLAHGGIAKLARQPEQSREALESICALGRHGLGDIRQLLSALRTEEPTAMRAAQPGIEDIAGLVDQAASTGLRATLRVSGEPGPVATGPALGAYRIVQEAITNTLKHADAATTLAVELSFDPQRLRICIDDDGRPRVRSAAPALSLGYGLAGMRERAALYGGSATAGPGADGGWTVRATLPIATGDAP